MDTLLLLGITKIAPLNEQYRAHLKEKLNNKTKPVGSLGVLEAIALRVGLIQQTLTPAFQHPHALIFAADHGVCDEGVSAFPQAVTQQMVKNFLAGGAAISVLAAQHELALTVIDAGVIGDLTPHPQLLIRKIAEGSANFTQQPALTPAQTVAALKAGTETITDVVATGCNIVVIGEMGIGNTTAAAAITHVVTGAPLSSCVGAGTGLSQAGIDRKAEVISRALKLHEGHLSTPLEILSSVGGLEIAMMVGAYLQAASLGCVIVVDGFIATAALVIAQQIDSNVCEYCIFSHGSAEQGHAALLQYLNRKPILNLDLRLGEGSGAALVYPLLVSSINLLNQMASFDFAGVSNGKN